MEVVSACLWLSGCSWSCCKRAVPATQMSAPESGRACTVACPFREDMCTLIVGADSNFSGGKSFAVAMNGVVETTRAPGRRGEGGFCGGSDERGIRRPRHTLERWPTFLQWWHVMLYAGHCCRPP